MGPGRPLLKVLVATSNPHKVREIDAILRGLPFDLVTLDAFPTIAAPEETGRTFEENARQKALYYAAATRHLTVAEDSGLEIDALGGAPGVESARFGGASTGYPEKFALIYGRLRALGQIDSAARFVCALALADGRDARSGADPTVVFTARGVVEGRIARAPAGSGGFGYDPIFFYPPYGRTLAEATPEEKAAVSHRGIAFRALADFLVSGRGRGPEGPPPG